MPSTLLDVYSALEQGLKIDTGLTVNLKGDFIYPWKVPEPKPANYITFAIPGEREADLAKVFNRANNKGLIQLDVWTLNPKDAVKIWKEIERILNNQKVLLYTGVWIFGEAELIHVAHDPDDDTLYHGIVRYTWETWTT